MVHEKLPQQIEARKAELDISQTVINEPAISREYIMHLQSTVYTMLGIDFARLNFIYRQ